jgi:chromosome partitioning protein
MFVTGRAACGCRRLRVMATIIAIANKKGGSGKTTTATNLAGAFVARGYSTLMVDADGSQSSAFSWRKTGESAGCSYEVLGLQSTNVRNFLKAALAINPYDVVLIDCPPRDPGEKDGEMLRNAVLVSNAVLIPVMPSGHDLRALIGFLQWLLAIRETAKPELDLLAFINNRDARTNSSKAARGQLVMNLAGLPIRVLDSEVVHREDIRRTGDVGLTVFELAPTSKGAAEYVSLREEILKWLAATGEKAAAVLTSAQTSASSESAPF